MNELDISFGRHRADTSWKVAHLTWPEFVDRLRKIRRTPETTAQYDAMTKAQRAEIKDGPAFVGGMVREGRRRKQNIDSRCLVTLDADNPSEDFLYSLDLIIGGTAHVVYSTHSHRPSAPRYRVVVLCDRSVSSDEYSAVSRKLAEQIGMESFDRKSFESQQLMYLPSGSKDADVVFAVHDGDPLRVDDLLGAYADWRDVSLWPRHAADKQSLASASQRAQDPTAKRGLIGLFCRAYAIEEAIDTFLADVYEPGSMTNRYTYLAGSSANGLEVYPDQNLAYSHQDSDPVADGRTYNAFDLVRVHKFGHLDLRVSEFTPDAKKPSHAATEGWASEQVGVKRLMQAEREAEYAEILGTPEEMSGSRESDWETKLELHPKTGMPLATAANVELLLTHGVWSDVLAYDAFGNSEVVRADLPWRVRERAGRAYEPWLGADDKRLLHWFAKVYRMTSGKSVIQNAFTEVVHQHTFHPIKGFLEATEWDGRPRAQEVFIRYLGAPDTHYTRQVTRKMLLAAITRLYRPGCKFDQMLVLIGPQGAGKSSLLSKLGREWFSDSLRTFENKEAAEHLQNAWIFEVGELSAMKRVEIEEVKAFLSKTEDRYRVAYDRSVSDFPRKCVFFGTTNTRDFLRDATGNRRFWPVDVDPERACCSHWAAFSDAEVRQVWAEVLTWFRSEETLELDDDARLEAEHQQNDHMEIDPREGWIREWLDEPIEDEMGRPTTDRRERVCAMQIWVECLGNKKGVFSPWEAKALCAIMRRVPGWKESKGRGKITGYGLQTVFSRVTESS